jgi:hypothetical protein
MPTANRGHAPLRAFLLDADAFINLRTLSVGTDSLLAILLRRARQQERPVYLTERVAEHELSDLQEEIASYKSEGLIEIEKVPSSDATYVKLRREINKGEAEAIAWSVKREQRARPQS